MIDSNSFQITLVRLTGRYFEAMVLSPFLKIADILAFFQSTGTCISLNDLQNSCLVVQLNCQHILSIYEDVYCLVLATFLC